MVIKEQDAHVRVLRLANPPANVLNMSLLQTLRGEIDSAARDPEVRCLVLASAYPRYFSTGLDLEELLSMPPDRRGELFGALFGVYHGLRGLPKPALAAIGGSAILGGWVLAMGCDFRLLTEATGRIALSEIRLGLSPGAELIARLRDIASSPVLVKEMVLRGRTLRADEALSGDFVDRLVPADALADEAMKEARQLCKLPHDAYAAVKGALSRGGAAEQEALWRETMEEFKRLLGGPEAQEGIHAMREKRRPRFAGVEAGEE
ncbi:MAG: enoyl-CoA hydratase/isomerase family protein [Elusimicrobia bacterium]|nr:enoyl-CoA hydratase/isomerase family protein [Elusimicrobiota bacterium]